MLGVGALGPPCNLSFAVSTIPQNFTTFSLLSPSTNFPFNVSLFSNACSDGLLLQGRTGFSVSALKKLRKTNNSLLEMDDGDGDGDGEDEDEDGDEEEDELFVPFGNMKSWLQNKPTGFGEGKDYETSLEDKMLEEMEQSRQAQLANINNLKNNLPNPNSKDQQVKKAPEVVPTGIRVRVSNLPKKKNIRRDLQLAFKGFLGIVNISPAVSGNKKTRDPVCKGFAFVDLKSEDDANRFIQIYSKQSIPFGKIQKQITCEITNPRDSSDSASEQSAKSTYKSTPQLTFLSMEENLNADCDMGSGESVNSGKHNLSFNSHEQASYDENNGPDQLISANWEEIGEDLEVDISEPKDNESMRPAMVARTESLSSKQRQNNRAVQKKKVVKRKSEKIPKLNFPGSANRLKSKEKAVLSGVFSKYGAKVSSPSEKES
ncbi:hypothetical protein HHK36_024881 [Tetracentron sinense]|uniref:RRM domain-containing protein n=1 Tax=Tetracentron sinense TaxID=13715 RepID=A0A834YNX7_TETSI|nr:hypothetical protein HHK36_024881 [Tetracentron sinense]